MRMILLMVMACVSFSLPVLAADVQFDAKILRGQKLDSIALKNEICEGILPVSTS